MAQARRALHALLGRALGKLPNSLLYPIGGSSPHATQDPLSAVRRLRSQADSGGAAWPPDPEPVRATLTMLAAFGEKEEGPPDSAQV